MRGFWEDFKYFASNNHPLLVLWYTDNKHPYSKEERAIEFLAAFCYTFMGAGFLLIIKSSGTSFGIVVLFSLLIVTLPTMAFRTILYYFLATPCLIHDESKASRTAICCLDLLVNCSEFIGKLFGCCCGCFFLIFGIVIWAVNATNAESLSNWMWSIAQTWCIWFPIQLSTTFLPDPSIAKPIDSFLSVISCHLLKGFVGKWHFQREHIQSIIRSKIKERGEEHFFKLQAVVVSPPQSSTTQRFGASARVVPI